MGDRFKNARVLEVSENSYLISNEVRLPILGKGYALLERSKSMITKKAYLLGLHPEYASNLRGRGVRKINESKDVAIGGSKAHAAQKNVVFDKHKP